MAKVAACEKEVQELELKQDYWRDTAKEMMQQLAACEKERDALVKDAARYLWLRNEHKRGDYLPVAAVVWKLNNDRTSSQWVNLVDDNGLDAAIDAAMEGK